MIRRILPRSTEELIHWYERYVSPASLLVGFAIDLIAVQVLDLWLYSFILLVHLCLAGGGILLIHAIETGRVRGRVALSVVPFLPVIVQFSFGSLLSGFIILYSKSAALAFNWIFIVLLAVLLLGNERFRRIYTTLPVQVGIFFFALFSFLIFYLPVVLSTVAGWLFAASSAVSLAAIALYFVLASLVIPERMKEARTASARAVAVVFLLVQLLYALNAIPPLPLALRDAGVFHSIVRTGDSYTVSYEPLPWYEFYRRYNNVFHRVPGEPVYVYTAIFAPSGIATTIEHEWERYDEERDAWVPEGAVSFPVSGGRDGGYRGYSLKSNPHEGEWRVNVRTSYGALIGRVSFEVVAADAANPETEGGER